MKKTLKRSVAAIGLTLCLRDKTALEDARKLAAEYRGHILAEIKLLGDEHQEMKNIRYLLLKSGEAGAVVAGLGIRYLFTDKPLITLNHKDDIVKISARGNKLLISKGLDLSVALRTAAEAVGGVEEGDATPTPLTGTVTTRSAGSSEAIAREPVATPECARTKKSRRPDGSRSDRRDV